MSAAPNEQTTHEPSGRPGRYQRSASGLVGALLVLALTIGAYVAFRALTRDNIELHPEAIDYLASVKYAQQSGVDVVYPESLPKDWIVTEARLVPGKTVEWRINGLTDDGDFVGLRQVKRPLSDLLADHVDKKTERGEAVNSSSAVARSWDVYTDAGGDTALAAKFGDEWVLVYGPASREELARIVDLLVTVPVTS